jgi:hypothetical protein
MVARSTSWHATPITEGVNNPLASSSLTIIMVLTYSIMKHELCVTDPQNVSFCVTVFITKPIAVYYGWYMETHK